MQRRLTVESEAGSPAILEFPGVELNHVLEQPGLILLNNKKVADQQSKNIAETSKLINRI